MSSQSKKHNVTIPHEIFFNEFLNPLQKFLFIQIDYLSRNPEGCYASNIYFSKFLKCGVTHVKKNLKILEKIGYISVKLDTKNKITKRNITSNLSYAFVKEQGLESVATRPGGGRHATGGGSPRDHQKTSIKDFLNYAYSAFTDSTIEKIQRIVFQESQKNVKISGMVDRKIKTIILSWCKENIPEKEIHFEN
jgi:ribosomal protein S8